MSSIVDKIFEDLNYSYDEEVPGNDCGRVDPRRVRGGEAEVWHGEKQTRHVAQQGAAPMDRQKPEAMTLRRKPIFSGDRNLYVLQRERSALNVRWWADVRDMHGTPLIGDAEYVAEKERHLMSGGVVVLEKKY